MPFIPRARRPERRALPSWAAESMAVLAFLASANYDPCLSRFAREPALPAGPRSQGGAIDAA